MTTAASHYLAALLLLVAAWAAYKRQRSETAWLLAAWAWFTSLLTISFLDQMEVTLRGVDIEPQNSVVLVVSGACWRRELHGSSVTVDSVADHQKTYSAYLCDRYGHRLDVTTCDYEATRAALARL